MFAKGGMAELYLARSVGPEGFEKVVVLKKILPSFAENAKFVRLFLDEARLAASLDHPNIAHVYDLGRVDGNYFFTMEYVHGQDVRKILARSVRTSPLPIDHAIQIARNVAGALHYAHERRGPDGSLLGIVHRDVSPSNIIVSYEGAVKLLDFGVAKAATSTVKTRTGTLKGKVAYMSPEQAKGAPIDRRSDVFSVGIVMWEMVATRRLYKADNDLATLQLIINQPPPLVASLRSDCPPELDRIIQRALAQDPADRYQTAQELQLDLDELAREHRLNQSSIALCGHMETLFADEIRGWRDAQASGVALTDHVIAISTLQADVPAEGGGAFDDSDDDDDGDTSSSLLSTERKVDADLEKTERTEPPIVATSRPATPAPVSTRAPTPVPASTRAPTPTPETTAPGSTAPKKKRKKHLEPVGWATQPSIVLDASLTTSEPESGVVAVEPPIIAEQPLVVAPRRSRDALATQIVKVVADPTVRPRRNVVIGVGAVIAIGVAAVVFFAMRPGSQSSTEPARPDPHDPQPLGAIAPAPSAAPDPSPEPAPDPVPVAEPAPRIAKPAPARVAKPGSSVARKSEPSHVVAKHPPRPQPAKPDKPHKPAPKFDPDAPLPPM